MPKRKLILSPDNEDSDLSPPPNDIDEPSSHTPKALSHATTVAKRARHVDPKTAIKHEEETLLNSEVNGHSVQAAKSKPRKRVKSEDQGLEPDPQDLDEQDTQKLEQGKSGRRQPQIRRKTKAEKEAETMPLDVRTVGHKLYIGAHVSSAGGVQNAVTNSVHIGANAFALFLKSQRKWANPPLLDDQCSTFHDNCKIKAYDQAKHVVPHGSYLVNLAHTDAARTKQAFDSYLDDLQRCERLGITLYNIHPGNANASSRQQAIAHLAANINHAHEKTSSVITLLENMAAGGNVLGSTFEDLRDIIALVKNKERIGVCIDTAHAFAGGYDLRTPEAWKKTMAQFQDIVGFQYLRAMHLNDSKAPFQSHRDLHANIGTGFLGLRAFHNLVNDSRLVGLPLVLETPITVKDADGNVVKDEKGKEQEDKGMWAREIKLLESMVGMDPSGQEFLQLEQTLARQGEPDRKKCDEQFQRKLEKENKAAAKKPRKSKGKKALKGQESTDVSDLSESDAGL